MTVANLEEENVERTGALNEVVYIAYHIEKTDGTKELRGNQSRMTCNR